MNRYTRATVLTVCAWFAGPVWSHHSAAQYDFSKTVMVEGSITTIEVRNPHIKLIMAVANDSGQATEIEYEGHSRNNVFRRGWRPDSLHVGDDITIEIAPLSDGNVGGGYIKSIRASDGSEF